MTRDIKLLATVTLIGGSVALSGCAEAIYPRLPGLGGSSSNSTLLSPTEQKKTIDDLTAEQKSHGTAAAKEIERRE
jgi:hypothetical protein